MSVEPISPPVLGPGFSRAAPMPSWYGRYRGLLTLLYAALDALLVWLAFAAAYWLRYLSGQTFDMHMFGVERTLNSAVGENFVPLDFYQSNLAQPGFVLLMVAVLALRGAYVPRFIRSLLDETSTVVSATTIAIAISANRFYFDDQVMFSRLMFVYVWAFTILFLVGARLLTRLVRAQLRRRGIGLRNAVVVGCGTQGRAIMQSLLAQPALGFRVVGFLDDEVHRDLGRIAYLGRTDQAKRVIDERRPDEVIIALPAARHTQIVDLLRACAASGARFRLVPDFYELSLNQLDTQYLGGIPLIGLRDVQLSGQNRLLKRAVDVVVAALLLVLFAPVLLLAALAIRLDSPGPILLRQTRVGKGSRHFTLYKFRSMKVNADAELSRLRDHNETRGATFKMRADPRRTRVGGWLRRLSIDELPQLLNVLRGDMSLVGPRPPLPAEVRNYEEWHRSRLEVAPGLTGIWQVSGRSDVPFDEMVLMDLWYIENWSLGLDLNLLLRTIPAVLFAQGAY